MPSLGHLFYSTKKVCDDGDMVQFLKGGECRRKILIESIGGVVERSTTACCNICSVHPLSSRLDIIHRRAGTNKRTRKRAVRSIEQEELKKKLELAREDFLDKHPSFRIVGIDFVCTNLAIEKLCEEAKYLHSADDIPMEIRPELRDIFFSVIISSSS